MSMRDWGYWVDYMVTMNKIGVGGESGVKIYEVGARVGLAWRL